MPLSHPFPKTTIQNRFQQTPFFAKMAESALSQLASRCERVALVDGEVLFESGDIGDALYIVDAGAVEVLASDLSVLVRLGVNQCVGEIALVSDAPRSATVRASGVTQLLKISASVFNELLGQVPELRHALARILLQRLPGLAAATSSLFGDLPPNVLHALESEMRWVHLSRGEVLFEKGDPGDELFLLIQGRLAVHLHKGVREISRGEVVGELALLSGEPRSATITGERDSVLVGLTRIGFQRVIQHHPSSMFRVTQDMVSRMRTSPSLSAGKVGTIAVLCAPGVDAKTHIRQLADALAAFGSTVIVQRSHFVERFPAAALRAADITQLLPSREWIGRLETDHRFLVFLCDSSESDWARYAIRQSDRVLLLAAAHQPPHPALLQVIVDENAAARTWVALVHEAWRRVSSGMVSYVKQLPQARTFQVDASQPQPYDSLARRFAGKAVSLILGGGGARAFAHLGVYRALCEAQIPIDQLGGASMGSFVAGGIAMDMDWQELRDFARSVWAAKGMRRRWTWPLYALLNVTENEEACKKGLNNLDIADLKVPFFATTSDITTPALRVLRTGSLYRAMRMSGSFPGMAPPIPEDGRLHIDGGMLNNLPLDVAQTLCSGPMLACDVGNAVALSVPEHLVQPPKPGLRALVSPTHRHGFPTFTEVLIRTVECADAMKSRDRRALAMHCFTPPLDTVGLVDFHQLDVAMESGYRHASEALESGALSSLLPPS